MIVLIFNRQNMKKGKILSMMVYVLIFAIISGSFKVTEQNSLVSILITGYYPDSKITPMDIIGIRGDNCNLTWTKSINLEHTQLNTWTTIILCPQAVNVNVKLLVNSIWMYGQNYNFISKQGLKVEIYPSFNPSINKIYDTDKIYSNILKNDRPLSIYIPPSFFDNQLKKYQVLLMQDGQNLFDPSKAPFGAWYCQDTLNKMMIQGRMRQIILVGIWNTNDRNNQYTYSYDKSYKFGGKGDSYLDFIQKQLIPILQNKILPGRIDKSKGYYIGGSSLGGLISCYGCYTRPSTFTKAICMSSSFWWNSQDFNKTVLSSNIHKNITIYLDSGDSGTSQDGKVQTQTVLNHLKKIGYGGGDLFYYLDKGGEHSEAYWGKRFNVPMSDLFG